MTALNPIKILVTDLDSQWHLLCFELYTFFIYSIFIDIFKLKKSKNETFFNGLKFNIFKFNTENVKNSKYSTFSGKSKFVFKIKIEIVYRTQWWRSST